MPSLATAAGSGRGDDRHARRAVWTAALLAVVVAGVLYADKAGDDRSAFVRWRPQVLEFWQGVNIYDTMAFPNPPIVPITLYPLMKLPPLEGAMTWFVLKAALAALAVAFCFRMVRDDGRALPAWAQGLVLLLSFRPVLSDLQHGNNNLVVLFLVVSCLLAWRHGHDVLAGLVLGLAISYKVTPALLAAYFAYRRSWRTVGATGLGLVLFLFVVPGLVVGPGFNLACLDSWRQKMLSPFLEQGYVSPQEINQSMAGVLTRLLTDPRGGGGADDLDLAVNLVAWPPRAVGLAVKAVSIGLVGLLALLCRTPAVRRDDPRLLGEFSLVLLTMLFVSERSWKHHYVTLLLPYTYLTYRVAVEAAPARVRAALIGAMLLSAALMATTSSELGGLFGRHGHKTAQGYGMFLWAGVVLYLATAWRVRTEGRPDERMRRVLTAGPARPAAALPLGLPRPRPAAG